MSETLQNALVFLAAAAAAGWLVIRRRNKRKGCDGCALVAPRDEPRK